MKIIQTMTTLILAMGAVALSDDTMQYCPTTPYIGPTLSFPVPLDATVKCSFTNQALNPEFDAGVLYEIESRQPHINISLTTPKGLRTANDIVRYTAEGMRVFELASKPLEIGTNVILLPSISAFTTNPIVIGSFTGVVLSSIGSIPLSGRLMYQKFYLLIGSEGGIRANALTLDKDSFTCTEALLNGVILKTKENE